MKGTLARWIGLIVLLIASAACSQAPTQIPTPAQTSLRRLDDHPFYEMYLVGDYGFDDYLQSGVFSRPGGLSGPSPACTVFAALGEEGNYLLGRSFDWYDHPMLILFTDPPAGYDSVSMVDISYLGYDLEDVANVSDEALQSAPFLPFDGMNAHGLAVGMMAVPHAEGGQNPGKRTLEELEMIRLILDYAQDVGEAIDLMGDYNVTFGDGPPIHYLLADASGASAVIEYLDGEMIVMRGEETWQVATNFLLNGIEPEEGRLHCGRYRTAYDTLEAKDGSLDGEAALALLEGVAQGNTLWSVVYHLNTGKVQVTITGDFDQVFTFQLEMD